MSNPRKLIIRFAENSGAGIRSWLVVVTALNGTGAAVTSGAKGLEGVDNHQDHEEHPGPVLSAFFTQDIAENQS
jgi:hypothetical protein